MAKPTRKEKQDQSNAKPSKPVVQDKTRVEGSSPSKAIMFSVFFVLSLLLYGNTITNGYSLDDELVTVDHPNVERGISGIPEIFVSRYSVNAKQSYEYRPIVLVTFALEYQFFGRNPTVSHFINILIYAFLCLAIFYVVKRLFNKQSWWLAFLTALLFLIHPVHNEVVASLKNRDELLSLLFSMVALLQLLSYIDTKKLYNLLMGLVLLLLAMLSKKSGIMFIVLIPFIFIYLKKVTIGRGLMLFALSFIVGALFMRLIVVMIFDDETAVREAFYFENPLYVTKSSILVKLNYAIGTFGFYICKYLVPYPLISYYGYNVFNGFGFGIYHMVGLAAALIMVFCVIRYWKSNQILVVGITTFCVSLFVFLNLYKAAPGIVAERFLFASSFGLSLVVAWLLWTIFKLRLPTVSWSIIPVKLKLIVSALTIVYAAIIIPRNVDWNSTQSLYKADVKTAPQSAKLHSLLGTIYASRLNNHSQGIAQLSQMEIKLNTDSAISEFRNVLKVYPAYASANNNLGTMYFSYRMNNDSAGYYFKKAIENDSDYVEAYFNLANYQENIAGTENEKYNWIKHVTSMNADSLVSTNRDKETIACLTKTNNVFFRLFVIKSMFDQTFRNFVSGKDKTPPQQIIRAIVQGYEGLMPELEPYKFNVEEAIEQVVATMKQVHQNKLHVRAQFYIDSVVTKIYSPVVLKFVEKECGIKLTQFNIELIKGVKKIRDNSRKICYQTFMKALQLKPDYFQVYGKLNPLLTKWSMYNELVTLNKFVLESNKYKEYSIEFALAEAYFLSGNKEQSLKMLVLGLEDLKRTLERVKVAKRNFSLAGNNVALSAFTTMEQMNLNNVGYYMNKLAPFLNEGQYAKKANELYKALMR